MTYVLFYRKYMFWGHDVTTGTSSGQYLQIFWTEGTQNSSTQADSLGQTYL